MRHHHPAQARPACGRARRLLAATASSRRRRSTCVPGDASSRAPSGGPGVARPSAPAPIYSGRAANASSRPSRYNRAGAAVEADDRDAAAAARDRDGSNAAADRAAPAEPRRRVANRPSRRTQRSGRSRATTSVDSWDVLFESRRPHYISVPVARARYDGCQRCNGVSRAQRRRAGRAWAARSCDAPPVYQAEPRVLGLGTQNLRRNRVKSTDLALSARIRLLFLCNRQDGDMKEWCDRSDQNAFVKKSKNHGKTNTYN